MPAESYPFASRLLHHLILGNRLLASFSHDLEVLFHDKDLPTPPAGHVFISGLARSGTTILLRALYASGCFTSLTYRDMPFVLAPNLWRRISIFSKGHKQAEERAHADGILVDYDSPEALDEVFWRVFSGQEYLLKDVLVPMSADTETIDLFRRYVALILRDYPRKRYLSKNNNNLLRFSALVDAFPDAYILIAFRHPVSHSVSLLRQHQHFTAHCAKHSFTRRYMGWLAHHEFGPDHRPFRFETPTTMEKLFPDTLDYWLQRWIDAYAYVADHRPRNSLLLCYERLCEGDGAWKHLLAYLQISDSGQSYPWRSLKENSLPESVDKSRLDRAHILYEELLRHSFH